MFKVVCCRFVVWGKGLHLFRWYLVTGNNKLEQLPCTSSFYTSFISWLGLAILWSWYQTSVHAIHSLIATCIIPREACCLGRMLCKVLVRETHRCWMLWYNCNTVGNGVTALINRFLHHKLSTVQLARLYRLYRLFGVKHRFRQFTVISWHFLVKLPVLLVNLSRHQPVGRNANPVAPSAKKGNHYYESLVWRSLGSNLQPLQLLAVLICIETSWEEMVPVIHVHVSRKLKVIGEWSKSAKLLQNMLTPFHTRYICSRRFWKYLDKRMEITISPFLLTVKH